MSSEESMDSARVSKYLNPARKEKKWWAEEDEEGEEESDIGRGRNEAIEGTRNPRDYWMRSSM